MMMTMNGGDGDGAKISGSSRTQAWNYYISRQQDLDCFSTGSLEPSRSLKILTMRTSSVNTSSTLTLVFAEVSKNGHDHLLASSWPSAFATSRSASRSHLLPTRINGTCNPHDKASMSATVASTASAQ